MLARWLIVSKDYQHVLNPWCFLAITLTSLHLAVGSRSVYAKALAANGESR